MRLDQRAGQEEHKVRDQTPRGAAGLGAMTVLTLPEASLSRRALLNPMWSSELRRRRRRVLEELMTSRRRRMVADWREIRLKAENAWRR